MIKIKSAEDALNYAIARESEAHRLYTTLAASVKKPKMRRIIEGFAAEELERKAKVSAWAKAHPTGFLLFLRFFDGFKIGE